jgi:energy-coupling factor transporter ATP-binding protein EcfA2
MRYVELELTGFKRLRLANIGYIKINPQEKLQLLLGTNGVGKSSLLKELSPLPAIAQEYTKEGRKRIVIEHRGHTYELTSSFSPTQRHSFIKDGQEELNPGGTASVQKELVKKEFNVTQDIHELITGAIVFTKMGPGERRYWLTRLSDTSYTYALGVYQKLKERQRDVQGAIKMNQSRAVQEANKLLSEEQETQLRAEIKEYREILDQLLTLKSPSQYFRADIEKELTHIEEEFSTISRQMIRIRGKFLNLEGFDSFEAIDEAIIKTSSNVNGLNFIIDRISKEIQTLQDTIGALTKANINNFQELDTKRSQLSKEIETLFQKVDKEINFADPVNALQALNTVQDSLTDIVSQIKPNTGEYTREGYQQLQDLIVKSRFTIQTDETAYAAAQVKKKAFEEAKSEAPINCPQCNHQWHLGYDPKTYEEVCQFLEIKSRAIETNKTTLRTMEETSEEYKQYFTLYRAYTELVRGWPILEPLWNHIVTSEMIFKNPNSILYLIDRIKGSIQLQISINALQVQLGELNEIKVATIALETNHIDTTKAKIAELEEELFKQNECLRKAQRYIQQLKDYKDVARFIKEKETYLTSLMDTRTKKFDILLDEIKQKTLNDIIRYVQLELTKHEQQLSQVDVQKGLVNNIRQQIKDLEEEVIVLAAMVKELSPTEGLIAKGLLGFINVFVKQMNSFIRRVWLYPMELIPCLPDNENGVDLDYKFSLHVNNNDPIPDIKMSSSAMAEVINLAFVIVAMKYLGLSDSPLLLDEFAARMDSAHRASAYKVINNLLLQSDFSQIFLVSHFEDCYGSMVNTDITVLCSKNIVIPKGTTFNQHTVIR